MKIDFPISLQLIHISKYIPEELYYNPEKRFNNFIIMNSSIRDKASKYNDEIKPFFKSYNNKTKKVKNFNDILKAVNSIKKNKFKNDSIKYNILICQEENKENILPE